MKRIVFLLIAIISLSSCSVLKPTNDGVKSVFLNVKIFQTLDKCSALAHTKTSYGYAGDCVKIVTTEDMYYDDLVVADSFVLVGTYSYVTTKDVRKTVPVYLKLKEYRKMVAEGRDINSVVRIINGQ